MLALTNTTDKLEVILAGAKTSLDMDCHVTYRDVALDENDSLVVSSRLKSNGTAAVTLLAAPTQSVRREIENITISNIDTGSVTVTIRINDGTSTWVVMKTTMVTLGTLVFEKGAGWVNYSAAAVRS